MDVFHFKVYSSVKKKKGKKKESCVKRQMVIQVPKTVCLKTFVCTYFFLILKIEAIFLFVDQTLDGLTAKRAPSERFCS